METNINIIYITYINYYTQNKYTILTYKTLYNNKYALLNSVKSYLIVILKDSFIYLTALHVLINSAICSDDLSPTFSFILL